MVASMSTHAAYQFAISPEEATRYAAFVASVTTVFRIQNPLSALAMRYLPWLNLQPKQPHKIGAFYVPTWVVDAAVEAKVWLSSRGEEGRHQVRSSRSSVCVSH